MHPAQALLRLYTVYIVKALSSYFKALLRLDCACSDRLRARRTFACVQYFRASAGAHVRLHACIHTHTRTHIYMHALTHFRIHTCTQIHTRTLKCVFCPEKRSTQLKIHKCTASSCVPLNEPRLHSSLFVSFSPIFFMSL